MVPKKCPPPRKLFVFLFLQPKIENIPPPPPIPVQPLLEASKCVAARNTQRKTYCKQFPRGDTVHWAPTSCWIQYQRSPVVKENLFKRIG